MQQQFFKLTVLSTALAISSFGLVACGGSSDNSTASTTTDSTNSSTTSTSTTTGTSTTSTDTTTTSGEVNISVNSANFRSDGLVEAISTVSCSLSDGTTGQCYKIVTKNSPGDADVGPWCPENIADDASKGGIWLENGEVHDVDGAFIQNLATFYNDSTWNMYDATTGAVTRTTTYDDFKNAANPNVGEEYKNHCVEGQATWVSDLTETFYIPVTPKKATAIATFATGPGNATVPSVRGLAFNGVRFDAPAPTSAILAAYTLAPFDDAGGHLNPYAGYHYHAATGKTTEISQTDGHAPMIGYALDGYAIYANTDADGNEATDLDEARGHYDDVRGYHYHVDKAGNNNFINGLAGVYATDGLSTDTAGTPPAGAPPQG